MPQSTQNSSSIPLLCPVCFASYQHSVTNLYALTCRVPEECPAEVAALIDSCMDQNPEVRPTAKEIIERIQALPPNAGMQIPRRGSSGVPAGIPAGPQPATPTAPPTPTAAAPPPPMVAAGNRPPTSADSPFGIPDREPEPGTVPGIEPGELPGSSRVRISTPPPPPPPENSLPGGSAPPAVFAGVDVSGGVPESPVLGASPLLRWDTPPNEGYALPGVAGLTGPVTADVPGGSGAARASSAEGAGGVVSGGRKPVEKPRFAWTASI